jgi:hypothetical protein
MTVDPSDLVAVLESIRQQAATESVRISQHAHQEMVEELIRLEDLFQAIAGGQILENYPEHRRGACCLLHGIDSAGRDIHLVCTTAQPMLIIITAYLPKPPKWISPTQRKPSS